MDAKKRHSRISPSAYDDKPSDDSKPDADSRAKKKQVPLRLSESLYNELAAWAEDEFRSLNGQIEYLLTQSVKKHRRGEK